MTTTNEKRTLYRAIALASMAGEWKRPDPVRGHRQYINPVRIK